jgi:hypothetical protein
LFIVFILCQAKQDFGLSRQRDNRMKTSTAKRHKNALIALALVASPAAAAM